MLWFFLLIGVLYLILMLTYLHGWEHCPAAPACAPKACSISVLVPARNEAGNIGTCLRALADQKLPAAWKLTIFVMNDHSSDGTVSEVYACKSLFSAHANMELQLLHLHEYKNLSSTEIAFKKRALEYALSQTTADFILTTDADCRAHPNWIFTMISALACPETALVTAPVLFDGARNTFERFQALDLCGTMGLTAAGIHQKWQHLANGANMGFKRAIWQRLGNHMQNAKYASGDDMFLVQALAVENPRQIAFVKSEDAIVWTKPEPNLRAFWNQRLRWGTKNHALPQRRMQFALGIAWVCCLCILLGGFVAPLYALVTLSCKALADFWLLRSTTHYFKQGKLLRVFISALFLHTFYIATVGTASIFTKKYIWKGRKVQ